MAIEKSNNAFDWCDDIGYAKTNFTDEESLNIFKKSLSSFGGIDKEFVNLVNNKTVKDMKFVNRYAPVYLLNIKATYGYDDFQVYDDETITTTHTNVYTFSKYTFKGVPNSLNLGNFVGRNDNRIFQLSHVDDLKYGLYGDNCSYTSSEMSSRVYDLSYGYSRGTCTVNRYDCTAIFVPVVCIYVNFKGKSYHCVINKHNGCYYLYYPVSTDMSQAAEKEFKTYKRFKFIGFAAVVCTFITALIVLFTSSFLGGILSLLIFGGAQGILIKIMSKKYVFDNTEKEYLNEFAKTGKVNRKKNTPIIVFAVLAIIIEVIMLILYL